MASAQQPQPDPIIEAACQAAITFTKSLPDYIVKQTTARYRGVRKTTLISVDTVQIWRKRDVVTADVVAQLGTESFKNIRVNGSPSKDVEKSGQWSAGEFSSTLKALVSPENAAVFAKGRQTTLLHRPAWRYDFTIDQAHSTWHLSAGGRTYAPAYGGQIWIDKDTSRVLRIEMTAHDVPSFIPLDSVEWTINYDFIKIGDASYLLPTHSEALDCERDKDSCFKNVTEFEDYKKFSADTSISFDDPPK